MNRTPGARTLVTSVSAVMLLITSCSAPVPEPDPEETTTAPTTAESVPEPEPEEVRGPEVEPTEESEPEDEPESESDPSPQECIVGVWKSDNRVFSDVVESMGPLPGSFDVEGDLVFNFLDNGDYFEIKDEFTLLVSAEGQTIRNVTTGSTTGSYAVEEDFIYFFDSIDVFHETYHEIPGIGRVDMATGGAPEVSMYDIHITAPGSVSYDVYEGAAAYECSEGELRLTVDGGTSVWHPSEMPDLDGWEP